MTLTTLPEHLRPMVEKAASDVFIIPNMPRLEDFLIAFLNACLEGGVAVEADGFNRIDGMEADSTPRPDGATFDFRALILNLGEAK